MEDCHRLLAEQWNRRVIPLHEMMGDCRKQFDDWWSEFTSAHEDWRFADSDALRWQAWQAAWNRRASPAGAPEGWKLVPVVPTDPMCDAAYSDRIVWNSGPRAIYAAMLSAVSTPPVSEDKDKIIAAANALENIASTSSSTRIRRVANAALTAIRARRNHG